MAEKRIKKGLCGVCPAGCGIEIVFKGERLHQIKPLEGHPLGIVCTHGVHSEEIVYSPDRLQFPSGTRIQSAFRSQHLNIPGLLKLQDKPNILIHPENAKPRGIREGDRVWVRTKRGKVPFYAKVTERIIKGVIEANMGGGGPLQPKEWKEANVNELTDLENRDPISGFPVFKALLCEVEKGQEDN